MITSLFCLDTPQNVMQRMSEILSRYFDEISTQDREQQTERRLDETTDVNIVNEQGNSANSDAHEGVMDVQSDSESQRSPAEQIDSSPEQEPRSPRAEQSPTTEPESHDSPDRSPARERAMSSTSRDLHEESAGVSELDHTSSNDAVVDVGRERSSQVQSSVQRRSHSDRIAQDTQSQPATSSQVTSHSADSRDLPGTSQGQVSDNHDDFTREVQTQVAAAEATK